MSNATAQFRIDGVDESVWIVHGAGAGGQGVFLEESSVGDLYDTPSATVYRARVGQPGAVFRGQRFLERHITLRLTAVGVSASEVVEIDSRLRKAFDYRSPAALVCTTETSGERSLEVFLESEPQYQSDLDMHALRVARWEFPMIAPDPHWKGETVTSEFEFDGLNWGGGSVTVANPSDVPAWPEWVISGQSRFILPDPDLSPGGDRDRQIALPFAHLGHDIVVDTDPAVEMITDTKDALLWAQMGGQFFSHQIPAKTLPTEIHVGMDPLPMLPYFIPQDWRIWLASKMQAWAISVGLEAVLTATPDQMASLLKGWMMGQVPSWLTAIDPLMLTELTASLIANAIRDQWASAGNLVGAVAQVRVAQEWTRPWGLE